MFPKFQLLELHEKISTDSVAGREDDPTYPRKNSLVEYLDLLLPPLQGPVFLRGATIHTHFAHQIFDTKWQRAVEFKDTKHAIKSSFKSLSLGFLLGGFVSTMQLDRAYQAMRGEFLLNTPTTDHHPIRSSGRQFKAQQA